MSHLKNIVGFLAIMQGNEGLMDKSPAYIIEKFRRYCESENPDEHLWGIDSPNTFKLAQWCEKWGVV